MTIGGRTTSGFCPCWPGQGWRDRTGSAHKRCESIRRIDNNGATADQILGTALTGRNKYDEAITAFKNAYNAAPTAVSQ